MNAKLKLLLNMSLLGLLGNPLYAHSSCLDNQKLTGVNLAGAEFNSKSLPGVAYKNYTYPKEEELAFIAQQGANVIRLPFRWERIQHVINNPLDKDELKRLQDTVSSAKAHGLCVILDVHNYAKFGPDSLADNAELQSAFVDLWVRLANVFTDPHATAFGLMNEPVHMPLPQWAALSKRTLSAIRKTKSENLVFIAGGHWSGLHDWFNKRSGLSNADAYAQLKDPLNRTILEVHQYADEDFSGTKTECRPPEHFDTRFDAIANWARENNQQLFLGEFGVPSSAACLRTLDHFLNLIDKENTVWKGWTYWAAGGWWGDYPLALNTDPKNPSEQWRILKPHFVTGEQSPPLPPEKPLILKP